MKAKTYVSINQNALSMIEAASVAYHSFDKEQAHRHEIRIEETLRSLCETLGFDLVNRTNQEEAE